MNRSEGLETQLVTEPNSPHSTPTPTPTPTPAPTPTPTPEPTPPVGDNSERPLFTAKHKVLLMMKDPNSYRSLGGYRKVRDLSTPINYVNQNTSSSDGQGTYDHSDAGIERAARNVVDYVISRQVLGEDHFNPWLRDSKLVLWDIESAVRSINVPRNVRITTGYPNVFYFPGGELDQRKEAIRVQWGISQKVKEMLKARRMGYEGVWYNIPNVRGFPASQSEIQPFIDTQSSDVRDFASQHAGALACNAQAITTDAMMESFKNNPANLELQLNRVVYLAKGIRERLGKSAKIICTLWPRWYVLGAGQIPENSSRYLNNDVVVPPGYMRRLVDRLMKEADVDGFFVWASTSDDEYSAAATERWDARNAEVADYILNWNKSAPAEKQFKKLPN